MNEPITFLDALLAALQQAGDYNRNDQVPPAAVLWTDKERQWESLLPRLRGRLPLLTLGDYDPAVRAGPAYYLRCLLAGTLPQDPLPAGAVPIIYLPGFGRQDMRAVEECPQALKPLVELQYRGTFWSHKNGRDWTVAGFLQAADGGLGIDIGSDRPTREAMLRALGTLAAEPLARLRKEAPLRAPFFDSLLNPDHVRRLLLWLDDPQGYPIQLSSEEWSAFCALCVARYEFHPEKDGAISAAARLGSLQGPWQAVWDRYSEAPEAYPRLPDLLRKAGPHQLSLFEPSPVWPDYTDIAEHRLREELNVLRDGRPADVRAAIATLVEAHGQRTAWVWTRLGRAPLVQALIHLQTLAAATAKVLGGATVPAIAALYATEGWQVDAAVLDALAAVDKADDIAAVKAALLPLYRPWLEQAAAAFQAAAGSAQPAAYPFQPLPTVEAGTCVLFCDALRFDLGRRLVARLEQKGLQVAIDWRLAALPPVTPTAKPAVSPVADQISGRGKHDLVPVATAKGSNVSAPVLRDLLSGAGYQVLGRDETGDPAGRAWTEFGAIDTYGHDHGWKLAHHTGSELRDLAGRVEALLARGWQRVVIVTDHGWLLLPGGLPKVELPQNVTTLRKGRCAVLKDGVDPAYTTATWHWDADVNIAMPPDIRCYEAGKEYEHGGLSPQECVVPTLTVQPPADRAVGEVVIEVVSWRGLRCKIELRGASAGMTVDIRSRPADPASAIIPAPRPVDEAGTASLLVENEDLAGRPAVIVVLSPRGVVLAQQATEVGV